MYRIFWKFCINTFNTFVRKKLYWSSSNVLLLKRVYTTCCVYRSLRDEDATDLCGLHGDTILYLRSYEVSHFVNMDRVLLLNCTILRQSVTCRHLNRSSREKRCYALKCTSVWMFTFEHCRNTHIVFFHFMMKCSGFRFWFKTSFINVLISK